MNVLEEFDQIIKTGYNSEKLRDIKPKLDSYLLSCPEEEKAKCRKTIELVERLIAECIEVDKLRQQYNLFQDYVSRNNSKSGLVDLEYIEPYGNSYGVYVKVNRYVMEMVFKPVQEPKKNEIRTKFYFDVDGIYKPFMIKKDFIPADFDVLQRQRRDYYTTSVRWDNWGDMVIKAIETVMNDTQGFLLICESSSPYMHKKKDDSRIEPIAITELEGKSFFIPSYQRGYRWTTQQIKELLEDIEDFIGKGANGIYCLQPLVVKEHSDTCEVIDGQQRLTTIHIILSCFGLQKYSLHYQTREKSSTFLNNIKSKSEDEAAENIDFYHMLKTRDFVLQWKKAKNDCLQEKADAFFSDFVRALLHKVKFIWYDTDTQDPIEVFTRLNIDKIPLTSAELIKAILLNRFNFENEDNYERTRLFQQELAAQWDQMENMLQNDEFWLFFHDDGETSETRIDYIFEIICDQRVLGEPSEDIGSDQSYVFRYFYDFFHRHKYNRKTLQNTWNEVRNIYDTLVEWYTHLDLYHYVGFLLARPKESTRKKGNKTSHQKLLFGLLTKWREEGMTVAKFKSHLIKMINAVIADCNDLDTEYESGGRSKTQCRPLLLLHNVETVIMQGSIARDSYGQEVFARFPFNLYKKEKWDVEHIDSNTTNSLSDFEEQKEWLLTTYIIATEEQRKKIERFCLEMQDEEDESIRQSSFYNLKKEIMPMNYEEERLTDDEKNKIWNFTLLDEGTNRGYGNAIFPAKRRIIIGKEQGLYYPVPTFNKEKGFTTKNATKRNSAFIPPCTKQAFLKYYSPTSGSMVTWTRHDAETYRKNMLRILSDKFNVIDSGYVHDSI